MAVKNVLKLNKMSSNDSPVRIWTFYTAYHLKKYYTLTINHNVSIFSFNRGCLKYSHSPHFSSWQCSFYFRFLSWQQSWIAIAWTRICSGLNQNYRREDEYYFKLLEGSCVPTAVIVLQFEKRARVWKRLLLNNQLADQQRSIWGQFRRSVKKKNCF